MSLGFPWPAAPATDVQAWPSGTESSADSTPATAGPDRVESESGSTPDQLPCDRAESESDSAANAPEAAGAPPGYGSDLQECRDSDVDSGSDTCSDAEPDTRSDDPPDLPSDDPSSSDDRRALLDLVIYAYDRTTSAGIRARLAEGLRAVGVHVVTPDGELFDPSRHEVGGIEPTDDVEKLDTVAETELAGFTDRGQIIREPVVVVYRPA